MRNNEPAFPRATDRFPDGEMRGEGSDGMSLRDYFAASAVQSLLATDGTCHFGERAREAYEVADAMMLAREAKVAE